MCRSDPWPSDSGPPQQRRRRLIDGRDDSGPPRQQCRPTHQVCCSESAELPWSRLASTIVLTNVVTLRLVPRWVTVFGRVNHLGAEPSTHAYSAWSHPLWVGWNEYPAIAGEVNRHIAWYSSQHPQSCSVRWCLAERLACGDQHRCRGSSSALEVLRNDALYKSSFILLNFKVGSLIKYAILLWS